MLQRMSLLSGDRYQTCVSLESGDRRYEHRRLAQGRHLSLNPTSIALLACLGLMLSAGRRSPPYLALRVKLHEIYTSDSPARLLDRLRSRVEYGHRASLVGKTS